MGRTGFYTSKDLVVDGDSELNGGVTVAGATSVAGLTISGNIAVSGGTGVTTTRRVAAYTDGGLKRVYEAVYSRGILISFNDLGIAWS